ncbi:hypothetical protein ACFX13_030149 [Malus domestica]
MGIEHDLPDCKQTSISDTASIYVPAASVTGQGRKSLQFYELFQMENWDGQDSLSPSELDKNTNALDTQDKNPKGDACGLRGEDPTTSGEWGGGAGIEFSHQDGIDVVSVSGQKQGIRKISTSSKIRKLYRKQKPLRKKLFPWNYDWYREKACIDEKMGESVGTIRKCKLGIVDHASVLRTSSGQSSHIKRSCKGAIKGHQSIWCWVLEEGQFSW